MSTHFTFFHIVSYYTGLLSTIYSYLIVVNCILYYKLVSLPQYYDYCVHFVFTVFIKLCMFS